MQAPAGTAGSRVGLQPHPNARPAGTSFDLRNQFAAATYQPSHKVTRFPLRKAKSSHRPAPEPDSVRAVRRQPVQERTQRKVMRILEVTAQLIERKPLDDISTTDIAKAAGITTGTVYRFFPHREAIFESILIRDFEKFRSHYEDVLAHSKARTGAEITHEVIDLQVKQMLSEPGFRVLLASRDLPPQVMRRLRDQSNTGALPAFAKDFVAKRLGIPMTPQIERRMELTTEITNSVLTHAFRKPDRERDLIVADLKRLLTFLVFGPEDPPIAQLSAPARGGKPTARKKPGRRGA